MRNARTALAALACGAVFALLFYATVALPALVFAPAN